MALRLKELGIGTKRPEPHLNRGLQLSVDSTNNEIGLQLTKLPEYAEQTFQTAKNLIAAGLDPRVKCVLTSINYDAPTDIITRFSAIGVTNFDFVQYGRSHYHHDDALFLTLNQKHYLRSTIQELRNYFPSVSITYQDDVSMGEQVQKTNFEDWNNRALCSGGRISMLVQPNGDVTLCDQIPHSDANVVGNILKDGLLSVWHSEKLYGYVYPSRDNFKGTICYDCQSFDSCHEGQGYCYRDTLFYYGSLYDAPPDCPKQTKPIPRLI